MLVINLVECQIFYNALHVEKLNDKDTIFPQKLPDAIGNRMEFFQMKENACSINDIATY